MPAAVAAPRQSCPDHPLVGMETATPSSGHAMSLPETPSDTRSSSATVVLIGIRMAGAVNLVGREVHQPDRLRLHLGGALAVAGGRQHDAVRVPRLPSATRTARNCGDARRSITRSPTL